MENTTIFLRIILTFTLSLIFGIERQKAHKPVGFGAFTFVSVGACCLSIVAIRLNPDNVFPLLGAIVTGIGFLGAGAMIKTTDKIFGITTAAGVWAFAIFGLIIGVGQYEIGLILYAVIWIVVSFDKLLAVRGIGFYQKKLSINTGKIVDGKEIIHLLIENGVKKYKMIEMEINKKKNKLSIIFLIEGTKNEIRKIHTALLKKDWLESCSIE